LLGLGSVEPRLGLSVVLDITFVVKLAEAIEQGRLKGLQAFKTIKAIRTITWFLSHRTIIAHLSSGGNSPILSIHLMLAWLVPQLELAGQGPAGAWPRAWLSSGARAQPRLGFELKLMAGEPAKELPPGRQAGSGELAKASSRVARGPG